MPPIIKQSAPHILISMVIAPVVLALFAWAGTSILGNREVKVLMPTVTKQLEKISKKLDSMSEKQDKTTYMVYDNRKDIAVIKATIKGE